MTAYNLNHKCIHKVGAAVALVALMACFSGLAQGQEPSAEGLPTLRILTPADGEIIHQAEVRLQIAVRNSIPGTTSELRTYVDGNPAPAAPAVASGSSQGAARDIVVDHSSVPAPALRSGEELRTLVLHVPQRDCAVSVEVIESGRIGERVTLHLRWGSKPSAVTVPSDLYGLLIGVSDYSYSASLPPLRYAAKDARDLREMLAAQKGTYGKVEIHILQDREATREAIARELEGLQRQATPNDVVVVFIAGHAINHRTTGDYYFVPYGGNLAEPEASLLPGSQLLRILRDITGKRILLLDTCHAGAIPTEALTRGAPDIDQFVSELQSVDSGLIVYTATTGRQLAKEYDRIENGVFTHALVEGLRGQAARQDGYITVSSLSNWLSQRVKTLTGGEQTPVLKNPNGLPDFPIAFAKTTLVALDTLSSRRPIYKRWWFWTVLGVGAAAIGASIAVTTQYARWPSFPERLSDGAKGDVRF